MKKPQGNPFPAPAGAALPGSPEYVLLLFLCLSFLLASLAVAWRKPLFIDEIECIHTAWKILSGEKIYRDFFQHHHPLYYQMLGPVIGIFGETTASLRAIRMLNWVIFLAIVVFTYLSAREAFGRLTALTGVTLLLASPSFLATGVEVRPDVPQVLLVLVAAYLQLRFYGTGGMQFLRLGALSLFLAFLFLQKTVYVLPVFLLAQLWSVRKGEMRGREVSEYWQWFAMPLLACLIWLAVSGGLPDYVKFNWLINYFYKQLFALLQPTHLKALTFTLLRLFADHSILYIFAALSLCVPAFDGKKRLIAILGFFTLATCVLLQLRLVHYYLVSFPFLAMLAAQAVHGLIEKYRLAVLLVFLSSVYPAVLAGRELQKTNAKQFRKIEYVLARTTGEDLVYDGEVNFNLFRRDLDYFWFQLRRDDLLFVYRMVYGYHYDLYDRIMERKPKVVSTFLFDQTEAKKHGIDRHYQPSPQYPKRLLLRTAPSEHPERHSFWQDDAPDLVKLGH